MTVAIYQQTKDGMIRIGVFRPRKYYSVRGISKQFMDKHPNADPSTLFISFRTIRVMGKWVDDPARIPFEL